MIRRGEGPQEIDYFPIDRSAGSGSNQDRYQRITHNILRRDYGMLGMSKGMFKTPESCQKIKIPWNALLDFLFKSRFMLVGWHEKATIIPGMCIYLNNLFVVFYDLLGDDYPKEKLPLAQYKEMVDLRLDVMNGGEAPANIEPLALIAWPKTVIRAGFADWWNHPLVS